MYQKTLTLILAFTTLFFLGYGITGFYSLDSQSLCVEDSDCAYAVCCSLEGKEYGVCGQESECGELSFSGSDTIEAPGVEKAAERSYIAVILGILLLFILAVVGYLEWKAEKERTPKKRTKR